MRCLFAVALAPAAFWSVGAEANQAQIVICGGPPRGWITPVLTIPDSGPPDHSEGVFNTVSISRHGDLRWNDTIVTLPVVRQYLEISKTMSPTPFTILEAEPDADCPPVHAIRAEIERSGLCRAGGCGESIGPWRRPAAANARSAEEVMQHAIEDLEAAAEEMARAAKEVPDQPRPR